MRRAEGGRCRFRMPAYHVHGLAHTMVLRRWTVLVRVVVVVVVVLLLLVVVVVEGVCGWRGGWVGGGGAHE